MNLHIGPSGHGKTELAKRMGELLSSEMECIDCTEMLHETDLFGPKKPYLGYELGSPLNNFLIAPELTSGLFILAQPLVGLDEHLVSGFHIR